MGRSVILLAALVAAAWASCPNQCSGHGRCADFDKCVCYKQAGTSTPTRYGYTGADCSLRTCPTGKAYDLVKNERSTLSSIILNPAVTTSKPHLRAIFLPANRSSVFFNARKDTSFQVRIMTVTGSASGSPSWGTFTWKFEEDEYYEPEQAIGSAISESNARPLSKVHPVTGQSFPDTQTGVFVYWDISHGGSTNFAADIARNDVYTFQLYWNNNQDFDESDSNSAHQDVECSGRGVCDYVSGRCGCLAGYTGEACQRTTCPNTCSGHGTCQSQTRFVTSAGIVDAAGAPYKYAGGWEGDIQYGCKCDGGYRGPDCSLVECPSGMDVMKGDGGAEGMDCSGRGLCDYGNGNCQCFKGYFGERCESQTNFV